MLELSTVVLLASLSAAAPPPRPANAGPEILVRGELICRPVTRTGTRIGASAVCRTRAQWESIRPGQYTTLDDAEAKLEVIGTPCGCH